MTDTRPDLRLDELQMRAAHVSPAVRQVVLAGPGSGKTEVVAELAAHLVLDEDVDPRDELLVLSFSNAAVDAVRRRLDLQDVGPVTVRTLDSIAAEIMRDHQVETDGVGFDRRIAIACDLIHRNGWDLLRGLRHVVVDEAQDVVGERAKMIMTLLEAGSDDLGFTVLGDPAQAIYDFQVRDEDTRSLLDRISSVRGEVVRSRLTGQYRARSRECRAVMALGAHIGTPEGDTAIDRVLSGLVDAGSIEEAATALARYAGTIAVLTETNGEALLAARLLSDAGHTLELRSSAADLDLDRWIADVAEGAPRPSMTRPEFDAKVREGLGDADPSVFWRALRLLTGGRTPSLDLVALQSRLSGWPATDATLRHTDHARFVVSTVHRAKGLEFGAVVLVDPLIRRDEGAPLARRRFVALTRGADHLLRAHLPAGRWIRSDERTRRWIAGGPKRWQTFGIEFRPRDVDRTSPPGDDTCLTQQLLKTELQSGSPIELILDPNGSTLDEPVYTLRWSGVTVGRTSEQFGADLARRIGPAGRRSAGLLPWPRLTGLRSGGVVTHVGGRVSAGEIGRHGMWLGVRAAGMVDLEWR